MKTVGLTFVLLLLLCPLAKAQTKDPTLLGTSGFFETKSGYSISYSVGELMVNSEAKGGYILTQGFQQIYKDDVDPCLGCEEFQGIQAYPNPVRDILKIYFYKYGRNYFTMDIYNTKGSKVHQKIFPEVTYGQKVEFDFETLPKELYLIHIYSSDGKLYSKFKIIKI